MLEAAALLDEPFSIPLLIDLGFSADALDPLFDNGIFREPFPNRAEFTNSELRNWLLGEMSWSKKRHFCEQVGISKLTTVGPATHNCTRSLSADNKGA
jgi:hypothetical protein